MKRLIAAVLTVLVVVLGAALSTFGAPPNHYFVVPLKQGGLLTRGFDPPDHRWLPGHRGVDFAAVAGQQVLSPADGTVSYVGWVVNRPVITITHHDGLRSSFEPVTSAAQVGAAVSAGETIGEVSADLSHCAATCLHWGLRAPPPAEQYLNPLHYLAGGGPIVLLPVTD